MCGCCVGVAVWFRTCALTPASACGLAAYTDVWPGFDSTSPAKSRFRFASHRTGNLAGKTEKSGTVGAFDKAGGVDTICILLKDVDPTAEKGDKIPPCRTPFVTLKPSGTVVLHFAQKA